MIDHGAAGADDPFDGRVCARVVGAVAVVDLPGARGDDARDFLVAGVERVALDGADGESGREEVLVCRGAAAERGP